MHLNEWPSCLDAGPEKTNMFKPQYSRLLGGRLSERGEAVSWLLNYFYYSGVHTHTQKCPADKTWHQF